MFEAVNLAVSELAVSELAIDKLEPLEHRSHIDLDFQFLKNYRFRKIWTLCNLAHGTAAKSRVAVVSLAGLLAVACS